MIIRHEYLACPANKITIANKLPHYKHPVTILDVTKFRELEVEQIQDCILKGN